MRKSLAVLALFMALVSPVLVKAQTAAQPQPAAAAAGSYTLGPGDKLHLNVFNEPTLSGDFEVSAAGTISLPLIGDVQAAHNTAEQVKADITRKLAAGYMKSPSVSLEVLNYRPFFILGEVMKPGSYNYVNGMSVVNAVALAGGYTYRADKDDMTLKHGGLNGAEEKANETSTVMPGDVINVPERFF